MYLLIFILGSAIGSFLNVLIDRLPRDESINGRSHCDYCKKKIAWYDMFPVLSFFILGGKTRCCGKKLSFQYPIVEMVTGIIFLLIYYEFSGLTSYLNLIILFGLASSLLVIFVSDLKYHLISDYILIALFVFSLLFHLTNFNQFQLILTNFIPSGLVISFPIFLIYFISKERAMGLGDVYLSGIMGFLLGWQAGFIALYIAFVTGAIFGLVAILFKNKKLKSKIAFGPFLVIGTVVMLFWGEKIMEMIKRIYGF
jgi:leader peptidase (prepilin peptidase) / N-methyltransferase